LLLFLLLFRNDTRDMRPIIQCTGNVDTADPDGGFLPRSSLTKPATIIAPMKSNIGQGMCERNHFHHDCGSTSITTCCLRNSGINVRSPKSGTQLLKVFAEPCRQRARCPLAACAGLSLTVHCYACPSFPLPPYELVLVALLAWTLYSLCPTCRVL